MLRSCDFIEPVCPNENGAVRKQLHCLLDRENPVLRIRARVIFYYLALWPFLSKLREASSAGRPTLK
jgi:hypothetical protein